jgi:molybdopterin-guanine dinucleotide biosynthesis protein A/HD superfamily phosphodiesterase
MIDALGDKMEASCLILAGGKGRRLSPDKPLLKIGGKPIIQRTAEVAASLFQEVIIVTNTPGKYGFLDLPLVADERRDCGPLMGIYSGLREIKHQAAFVCAADMPFLSRDLIRAQFHELNGFDIVVPCPWTWPEFLHAFYRKRCLPVIQETLDANLYKIELLTQSCRTLRLGQDWFARQGLQEDMELSFININTLGDYRRWGGRETPAPAKAAGTAARIEEAAPPSLLSIDPGVMQEIRRTLIDQETAYQQKPPQEPYASLWAHSFRAGRIAQHIAQAEGWEPEPALLAGLLHDTGKFAHGGYHEDDVPEERNAIEFVIRILAGTAYQKWIPLINQAILSMYLENEATSDLGRAVYDADNLDKLGCMGIAQFFSKNSLRRRFLDDELMLRASIELTYAYHAPDTLKTATGQSLARERGIRTRRFYRDLLHEWKQLGLGEFDIVEEDIAGIVCLLVVPRACACGGRLELKSDIRDDIKCRSVVMKYPCAQCGKESEYSFCLPRVKGLPLKK